MWDWFNFFLNVSNWRLLRLHVHLAGAEPAAVKFRSTLRVLDFIHRKISKIIFFLKKVIKSMFACLWISNLNLIGFCLLLFLSSTRTLFQLFKLFFFVVTCLQLASTFGLCCNHCSPCFPETSSIITAYAITSLMHIIHPSIHPFSITTSS